MRPLVLLALIVSSMQALAQQPPQPSAQQKDRKDYLLEAVESQRNDAQAKLAICYADANGMIAQLNAQVADLKAELAKKEAPANQ
jgi:hypothetical protein